MLCTTQEELPKTLFSKYLEETNENEPSNIYEYFGEREIISNTTSDSRQNSTPIFNSDQIENKMATLKEAFLTTPLQQPNVHQAFFLSEENEDNFEDYKNYFENNNIGNNLDDNNEYDYISENTPNFVNNEYFNNIIDHENEKSEEELLESEDNQYYYNNFSDSSDVEENTSFNHLELEISEHSDSDEETKPKEQRSFHMYIPKTLTPKSKKFEKVESSSENAQTITQTIPSNPNHINEIPIPQRSEQNLQLNSYQNEYVDEISDSSTKFKMLKRNSRWGNLLNKISKPGTYVPPTNKHSKDAVLNSKKTKINETNSQKTETKQDNPTKPVTIQKKNDNKKQPENKKLEKTVAIENEKAPPKDEQTISNQEKTLKSYFTEPVPDDLLSEEDSITQCDEEGWGTFINRNTVYNPYNYEQTPIGTQKNYQSSTVSIPSDQDTQKSKTLNNGSIISNFFLPKSQEEEKKRQIKEKIVKKKEDKKLKDQEESKLQELEDQLIFYRNENEKTKRLKDELQVERQNIECEKSEFKRFMEEEREKFDKYKQEETQKLKREKRILERNIKDQQQSLSRKEHEKEVNNLKEKIEKITIEFKNERSKLKSNIQALKTRNEQLQEKLIELEENLKKRELERIDNNFRKKQSRDNTLPTHSPIPIMTTKTDSTTTVSNNDKINAKLVENVSIEKQSLPKVPYPNNHKLGLLKKTFKVSDNHFKVTWENENIGEVVTSRREVGKGKIEILFNTGRRDVEFSNGSVKKILPDRSSLIYFNNGDIKKTFEDGLVIYFFNNLKTTQITYPTGAEMYKFSNNQIETHFPGGEKEVIFPDKTIKFVDNNGSEEIWFSDGTYSRND